MELIRHPTIGSDIKQPFPRVFGHQPFSRQASRTKWWAAVVADGCGWWPRVIKHGTGKSNEIHSCLKSWVGKSTRHVLFYCLVGGLEHFLLFHIFGIIIPIEFHIFQGVQTTNQSVVASCFHQLDLLLTPRFECRWLLRGSANQWRAKRGRRGRPRVWLLCSMYAP